MLATRIYGAKHPRDKVYASLFCFGKPDLSITETDLHELCYSDLLITYIAVHRD